MTSSLYIGSEHGQFRFPLEFWILIQRELAAADGLMKLRARQGEWEYVGDKFEGAWPLKGLKRKRGLDVEQVSVSLNPDYLQTRDHHYALIRTIERRIPFFTRRILFDRIKQYSSEQVQDIAQLRDDLEALVGPIGGAERY
jgi:hypothetical protein